MREEVTKLEDKFGFVPKKRLYICYAYKYQISLEHKYHS